MAVVLRQADDRQAYTLTDDATFWQLERQLELKVLFPADDPRLLNTYAVIYPPRRSPEGARFSEWLTQGTGRMLIAGYRIQGRPAFTVWPSGCAGNTPASRPC